MCTGQLARRKQDAFDLVHSHVEQVRRVPPIPTCSLVLPRHPPIHPPSGRSIRLQALEAARMWQQSIDATTLTQAHDGGDFDSAADPLLDDLTRLVVAGRAVVNPNAPSNLPQARPRAFYVKHAACMVCSAPRRRRCMPTGVRSPI